MNRLPPVPNRESAREAFRRIYRETAGITADKMVAHVIAARLMLVFIAVVGGMFYLMFDWQGMAAGVIAALIVWGFPVVGAMLLGVVGIALLAVLG